MPAPLPLIQRRTFAVFFLAAVLMLGLVLWPFWNQLFLAFFLASVFHPTYNWISTRTKPWIGASVTCLLITLCVFLPLLFCIAAISAEIPGLIALLKKNDVLVLLQQTLQSNTVISRGNTLLSEYGIHIQLEKLPGLITELSTTVALFLYNQVSGWAADIMRFILQFCIMTTGVFFLLIEFEHLTAFFLRLSPLPEPQNRYLTRRFSTISGAILIGNSLSGVIQGVCGGIFFAVMGLISPVLWGAIMAVFAFLPIVGIGLVLVPTAVILYVKGHVVQALITFGFYMLLSFSIDYLFKPKFVGVQAQLPPLLVLLSILGGMSLFGVMGIIYGPLAVTAFLTLSDMYFKEYQSYFEQPEDPRG